MLSVFQRGRTYVAKLLWDVITVTSLFYEPIADTEILLAHLPTKKNLAL